MGNYMGTKGASEKWGYSQATIVNECCEMSNVEPIKGLNIGTFDIEWSETSGNWITTVRGTFYPCNAYGEIGKNGHSV